MYQVCRLCFNLNWKHREDGRQPRMKEVIDEGLGAAGITMLDIEAPGTHFGNWVLTPLMDNEATANLCQALNELGYWAEIDMRRFVLEQEDIDDLWVGDKVRVQYTNAIAGQSFSKGTVVRFDEVYSGRDEADQPRYARAIVIRKYKSKTKGWRFQAGSEMKIEKGW